MRKQEKGRGFGSLLKRDLRLNRYFYIMLIPVVVYYIIFCYVPMYGASIAFQDYKPALGFGNSPWVGFQYFNEFFQSYDFWKLIRNTLMISLYSLLFAFPAPILFAILLNEVRSQRFKKIIQTVTYLPHFISLVIICGLVIQFTSTNGVINQFFSSITGSNVALINDPGAFRAIYIVSGIWQEVGFGSILYLAAISGIDPQLYEAAILDGCGKWKQIKHITLPCILPTIMIMLILQVGSIMSVGWEKVFLLYSPLTYETADVISTYVYRKGIQNMSYSYSTAVGLFNSVINFVMIIIANGMSQRLTKNSLW